jgi:hypothetical protein
MTEPPRKDELLSPLVARARARLARVEGRSLLRRRAFWAVGVGALCAAARPLYWPLHDVPLWMGLGRALLIGGVGLAVASAGLIVAGRRKRPSDLGAARAIDEALGTPEVVASGFAFERDGRGDAGALLARRRGEEAARGVDVEAKFPLPSLAPGRRSLGRASLCLAGALALGAYDRVLVGALIDPPTDGERRAASALEQAAAGLAEAHAPPPDPKHPEAPKGAREKGGEKNSPAGPKLVEKALEAARAAKRGDRQGALDKLDELRSAGRSRAAQAADLRAALKQVAAALDPPKGGAKSGGARSLDPSSKAADSLRLLAKKMRDPQEENAEQAKESNERTLERLERAGEEARKAAGQGDKDGETQKSAGKAAEALSKAAEALSKGDREAAAKMLEEAAAHAEAMDQARAEAAAEAAAIAEMLEKSGDLERAIEMAMLGKDGQGQDGDGMAMGEGDSGGQGDKDGNKPGKGNPGDSLRRALAARLMAMGMSGQPDTGTDGGGSIPDRKKSKRDALEAKGSIRAPSEVGEGERAIQAIQGLGKGSDPPASYREVFPSYDAAVEEGLADERIPAARRMAVRKYFESIRPGQR